MGKRLMDKMLHQMLRGSMLMGTMQIGTVLMGKMLMCKMLIGTMLNCTSLMLRSCGGHKRKTYSPSVGPKLKYHTPKYMHVISFGQTLHTPMDLISVCLRGP